MGVIRGTIEEFETGAWVADIETLTSDPESGTFTLGGVEWVGQVFSSRSEGEVRMLRIFGGTARLTSNVASRSFRDTELSTILKSLLTTTGFEGTAIELTLPIYCVLSGPLGQVLNKLTALHSITWWVTRSGSIELGTRTGEEITADRIASDIGAAVYLSCTSCSQARPGDLYEGAAVRHVRWRLTPERLLAELSFKPFYKIPDPDLGYGLTYAARIVRQNSNESGTLPSADVLVGGTLGITQVPLLVGGPMKVKLEANDLVRVAFEFGDPRRPYISNIVQKGSKKVAREGDTVNLGSLQFVDSGATGPEILTWIPPPTAAMPVPVPMVIGASPVELYGVIDDGSEDVLIP